MAKIRKSPIPEGAKREAIRQLNAQLQKPEVIAATTAADETNIDAYRKLVR